MEIKNGFLEQVTMNGVNNVCDQYLKKSLLTFVSGFSAAPFGNLFTETSITKTVRRL